MAKSRTFQVAGETGVTVYAADAGGNSIPVRLEPGETYATADEFLIAALDGSPEVAEVKAKDKGRK